MSATCSPDWFDCDVCSTRDYTDDNPFVEVRLQRPSDPSDLACVMAGHSKCLGGPVTPSGAVGTPKAWNEYIESSEAGVNGHLFIS